MSETRRNWDAEAAERKKIERFVKALLATLIDAQWALVLGLEKEARERPKGREFGHVFRGELTEMVEKLVDYLPTTDFMAELKKLEDADKPKPEPKKKSAPKKAARRTARSSAKPRVAPVRARAAKVATKASSASKEQAKFGAVDAGTIEDAALELAAAKQPVTASVLRGRFPGASRGQVADALGRLVKRGRLEMSGKGRAAKYMPPGADGLPLFKDAAATAPS